MPTHALWPSQLVWLVPMHQEVRSITDGTVVQQRRKAATFTCLLHFWVLLRLRPLEKYNHCRADCQKNSGVSWRRRWRLCRRQSMTSWPMSVWRRRIARLSTTTPPRRYTHLNVQHRCWRMSCRWRRTASRPSSAAWRHTVILFHIPTPTSSTVPWQVLEDVPPAADGVEALVGGLAPRVLTLFCSPHADIKRLAVGVMNLLAAGAPPGGLGAAMETYRLGLFGLARDPAPGVRRAVCSGLVQLLHLQPEALVPQMRDIIEYMLESSR